MISAQERLGVVTTEKAACRPGDLPHCLTVISLIRAGMHIQLLSNTQVECLGEDTYILVNTWADAAQQVSIVTSASLTPAFQSLASPVQSDSECLGKQVGSCQ